MHIAVLQKEVLEYLAPKPNENFIDATISEGGHGAAIIEKILPNGKLLGIDRDEEIIRRLKIKNPAPLSGAGRGQKSKIKNNLILVCDNFANLKRIVESSNFKPIDGILFDLGMSSWHLEKSGRGFSFQKDEPLDMRYSVVDDLTAEKIVNEWPQVKIEQILKEYGGERFSKKIAKKIYQAREIKPIKTTFHLVEIIKKAVPKNYKRGRIHPATRTFQALRIAVNNELEELKIALPQALEVLGPGGRLVVLSFHSGEDKIVKNFFKEKANEGLLEVLTPKPIRPTEKEIKINPRSRSARLRAVKKSKIKSQNAKLRYQKFSKKIFDDCNSFNF